MKPRLLLYCQHSLGLGHFMRSLTLAEALSRHFSVCFFNGGPVPMEISLPGSIRFIHLPPLRMEEDGSLSGEGEIRTLFELRRERMLAIAGEARVAALLVELYPFGRKKFAGEIDPLVNAVKAGGGKVVCSVRDLLVSARNDQARHDQRAADKLNAGFDAVLVHSDPRIFKLEESFRPADPVNIPVHHTGFVARAQAGETPMRGSGTLVTAGGGIVGRPLYEAAIDAQPRLWKTRNWPMTIVAGPLLAEADWDTIRQLGDGVPGLTLLRAVHSMQTLLASAGRVVSQCGYNSALEILQSGCPALFVPFARGQENEQTVRARRFAALRLADWAREEGLDGTELAGRLLAIAPANTATMLNMDGASASARIVAEMAS